MKNLVSLFAAVMVLAGVWIPAAGDAPQAGASWEEPLYSVLEEGLKSFIGLSGETGDYIDLSGFGLSSEKDSEDRLLLFRTYKKVLQDHPEYFYATSGYWGILGNSGRLAGIRPEYYAFASEPEKIQQCNAAIEEVLAQVEDISDLVEQMLVLHDYLISRSVYNWEVAVQKDSAAPEDVRSVYAALVQRDTVCRGFACAYQVLLSRLGIECLLVESEPMNHVWNMVRLDGAWYHVDLTRSIEPNPTLRGRCRHEAFLVSDEALRGLGYRDWEVAWMEQPPACTSRKYESGWAFCGVMFPLYCQDGSFYSLRRESDAQCGVYRGGLSGTGERVGVIPLFTNDTGYIYSGVVWHGDSLYYVQRDGRLMEYRLADGSSTALGTVPFSPGRAQDGSYEADRDAVSLYLEGDTLIAASRTRREVLAEFPL